MIIIIIISGAHCEKIKNEFQKLFRQQDLKLIIKCNLKTVDFLDVTLYLTDSTYKPYHKPSDEICYIHKESNYLSSITKQLPISIETRLNPPFSKSVATKIDKTFLRLIDKHFPPHHKLHKLFNRNNVKISYSCMPNVKSIINKHNNSERTCNCINSKKCLLQQKCLTNNIMYKATITSNQDNCHHKIYYGITETKFKQRYANHIKFFRHEKHQSDNELSNELWSIKNKYTPNIVWEILRKHQTHNPNTKRCSLCLNEKLEIATYKGRNLLNKRSEIINKCRHRNKFALALYDSKD